jgi:hypothetical protein
MLAINAANSAVRGATCSTATDSCAACAPSPTAPRPSSVGTPSAAVKLPSESSGQLPRPFVESHRARPALHRRTIQTTRHFQGTLRIGAPQPVKQLVHLRRVAGLRHPHIHFRPRLPRNHIRPRPAADHPWIHRPPHPRVREARNLLQQPRQLQDCRVTTRKVHSAMRRHARHFQPVIADPLARRLAR